MNWCTCQQDGTSTESLCCLEMLEISDEIFNFLVLAPRALINSDSFRGDPTLTPHTHTPQTLAPQDIYPLRHLPPNYPLRHLPPNYPLRHLPPRQLPP